MYSGGTLKLLKVSNAEAKNRIINKYASHCEYRKGTPYTNGLQRAKI